MLSVLLKIPLIRVKEKVKLCLLLRTNISDDTSSDEALVLIHPVSPAGIEPVTENI